MFVMLEITEPLLVIASSQVIFWLGTWNSAVCICPDEVWSGISKAMLNKEG